MTKQRTILITGGAKRIGNQIARALHEQNCNLMIHYRSSDACAKQLAADLNSERQNSCHIIKADFTQADSYQQVIKQTINTFGQLDGLVNNASSFYPTPLSDITEEHWNDLLTSNLKAPLFLAKHAAAHLKQQHGVIINIVDIYANRPLANHTAYCAAKAGLQSLTKSLAIDLAPQVRVNGIAPGAILWPEHEDDEDYQQALLQRIPLQRLGEPNDIARTVRFLICDAPYISGQIIAVDGGRSILP
ncbi:MAG: pteridine reductase [Arenicella sp.]